MKTKETSDDRMGKCEKCGATQFLSYITCNYNGICKGKIVPIELSTREKALAWWKDLKNENKIKFSKKYYPYLSGSTTLLNQYEIELIWLKETQEDYSDVAEAAKKLSNTIEELRKPNQKQFKQFDESLFKAYIDKFSNEDKIEMFEVLFKESKKWDGVNNAAPFYMSICRAYNAGKKSILNQKSAQDRGENPEKFFVSSDTYFKKEFGFE